MEQGTNPAVALRVIRIIWAALLMGVLSFFVAAYLMGPKQRPMDAKMLELLSTADSSAGTTAERDTARMRAATIYMLALLRLLADDIEMHRFNRVIDNVHSTLLPGNKLRPIAHVNQYLVLDMYQHLLGAVDVSELASHRD